MKVVQKGSIKVYTEELIDHEEKSACEGVHMNSVVIPAEWNCIDVEMCKLCS